MLQLPLRATRASGKGGCALSVMRKHHARRLASNGNAEVQSCYEASQEMEGSLSILTSTVRSLSGVLSLRDFAQLRVGMSTS